MPRRRSRDEEWDLIHGPFPAPATKGRPTGDRSEIVDAIRRREPPGATSPRTTALGPRPSRPRRRGPRNESSMEKANRRPDRARWPATRAGGRPGDPVEGERGPIGPRGEARQGGLPSPSDHREPHRLAEGAATGVLSIPERMEELRRNRLECSDAQGGDWLSIVDFLHRLASMACSDSINDKSPLGPSGLSIGAAG